MVKYQVKITPQAFRDIDMIYDYIARHLLEPGTANNLVDEIEAGIFSLEEMPNRGAPRRIGNYANKGYRQLFIKKLYHCLPRRRDRETSDHSHSQILRQRFLRKIFACCIPVYSWDAFFISIKRVKENGIQNQGHNRFKAGISVRA